MNAFGTHEVVFLGLENHIHFGLKLYNKNVLWVSCPISWWFNSKSRSWIAVLKFNLSCLKSISIWNIFVQHFLLFLFLKFIVLIEKLLQFFYPFGINFRSFIATANNLKLSFFKSFIYLKIKIQRSQCLLNSSIARISQ